MSLDSLPARMGRVVAQHRDRRGWTLRELAQRSGVDVGALSRIERGERDPTATTVVAIADALEVSIDELFGRAQGPSEADLLAQVAGALPVDAVELRRRVEEAVGVLLRTQGGPSREG